jgi:DNA-binding transcriptional regulator YiaG
MHLALGTVQKGTNEVNHMANENLTPTTTEPRAMLHADPEPHAVSAEEVEAQGGVIRYLRRTVGLTQEELAHALGITVGTVSRWEKGRFRPSRLARTLILDFARSHNVTLDLNKVASRSR